MTASGLDLAGFKLHVVRPALAFMRTEVLVTEQACSLVTGTALHESRLVWLHQSGTGPALGLFQMEPVTHDDMLNRYLPQHASRLHALIVARWPNACAGLMVTDLLYAGVLARVRYMPDPAPLPDDARGMAMYYKRCYNTSLGAANVDTALVADFQAAILAG